MSITYKEDFGGNFCIGITCTGQPTAFLVYGITTHILRSWKAQEDGGSDDWQVE
jgi:hypothetical protein